MCCSIVHFLGKEMNGWTPNDRCVGGNARRLGWPVLARSAGVLTGPSKYPDSSRRRLPMPRGKLRKSVFDKYGMYVSPGYLALSGFTHLIIVFDMLLLGRRYLSLNRRCSVLIVSLHRRLGS